MDQSNRYADLGLIEAELIKGGRHILVAYKMNHTPDFGSSLQCAAQFPAESSTVTTLDYPATDYVTSTPHAHG